MIRFLMWAVSIIGWIIIITFVGGCLALIGWGFIRFLEEVGIAKFLFILSFSIGTFLLLVGLATLWDYCDKQVRNGN